VVAGNDNNIYLEEQPITIDDEADTSTLDVDEQSAITVAKNKGGLAAEPSSLRFAFQVDT
jgi:hypothetical protein